MLQGPGAGRPGVSALRALHGPEDELLTVKEVAAELKVCTATVYKLVDRGDLPHVRVLNSIRVRREALSAWLTSAAAAEGNRGK